MANPQPDVFVKYSKELMDAVMKTKFSDAENRIFLAVMRLTYGANPSRKSVYLERGKLSKMTCLGRRQASRAKHSLIKRLILNVDKIDDDHIEHAEIQKDYMLWDSQCQQNCPHTMSTKLSTYVDKIVHIEGVIPIVREREEEKNRKRPPKRIPYQQILDSYLNTLQMLPNSQLTPGLKKHIRARWLEDKTRQSIDWWNWYFNGILSCPWLIGKNRKGWRANLLWLVRPTNMEKVLAGYYNTQDKQSGIAEWLKGV